MSPRPNIELTPDEQAAFFHDHHKCALATLDRDGFPHVVAMNFFVKDGAFYMTSYGKAQKVLNIRRNPKVALMVEAAEVVRGGFALAEGDRPTRDRLTGALTYLFPPNREGLPRSSPE